MNKNIKMLHKRIRKLQRRLKQVQANALYYCRNFYTAEETAQIGDLIRRVRALE